METETIIKKESAIRPVNKEININLKAPIDSKPKAIHPKCAAIPVIKETKRLKKNPVFTLAFKIEFFLILGNIEPIWRPVVILEEIIPKILPLVPIIPGTRINKPGRTFKYVSRFIKKTPANISPNIQRIRIGNDCLTILLNVLIKILCSLELIKLYLNKFCFNLL